MTNKLSTATSLRSPPGQRAIIAKALSQNKSPGQSPDRVTFGPEETLQMPKMFDGLQDGRCQTIESIESDKESPFEQESFHPVRRPRTDRSQVK